MERRVNVLPRYPRIRRNPWRLGKPKGSLRESGSRVGGVGLRASRVTMWTVRRQVMSASTSTAQHPTHLAPWRRLNCHRKTRLRPEVLGPLLDAHVIDCTSQLAIDSMYSSTVKSMRRLTRSSACRSVDLSSSNPIPLSYDGM